MTNTDKVGSWERAVQLLREAPDKHDLVTAAYYDDPLLIAAERYYRSEEWQAITQYLPSTRGRALDVGAGRGIASYALAKQGFNVTALEPDGSAIVGAEAIRGLARESDLKIEVTEEFSERLPFADAEFDVVFARAVLHHTSDLATACKEFFRVLKPGGRFVAVREHVISHSADLQAFLDQHPLHKLYGGENAFLLPQYQNAITSAGFKLCTVITPFESPINYAPYNEKTLKAELVLRISLGIPGVRHLVSALLDWRPSWLIAREALRLVDHRPGRLYSFIADRP